MALTGGELVDEVKAFVGRSNPDDAVLVTDTRITRALNAGQRKIVEKCPGLHSLTFKNTTSLDTTQVLQYAIADITVGDVSVAQTACHIWDVWYLNGNNTIKLIFAHTDEFDLEYPDPTHSDFVPDLPRHWTRRGNYIEIYPLCATAYCDKDLRFDGDFYPEDLTTNTGEESDISNADEGLIMYGIAEAWAAIGNPASMLKSQAWHNKFNVWLEEFKEQNDTLHEWNGNLYSDEF